MQNDNVNLTNNTIDGIRITHAYCLKKSYLLVQVTHNVVQRGLIITDNLYAIGTMALFLSTLLNPIVRVGDQRENILYFYMRHCCLEASS